MEGFDLSQSGQNNVHILSRALGGPVQSRTVIRLNIVCQRIGRSSATEILSRQTLHRFCQLMCEHTASLFCLVS